MTSRGGLDETGRLMPYYPDATMSAYRCPGCGRYWDPGNTSCTVAHPSGSCCHEFEHEVTEADYNAIRQLQWKQIERDARDSVERLEAMQRDWAKRPR